ncbi:MAG: sugar ABC transporter ATP-binding protein [Chelatococcus sp.]|uniref:ATP-binding cassette domain-containing protein n=1 Tax=unclassified Chelatococcus TaxID=2638111 RepID=UPI001BCCEA5B|nr:MULTISPECIES: ATP-binding cassette domain-containing protein [unclassified Chelatococcus]CAH1648361.1 Fructose import ATP-binding protein FrcA [Hyphomicrobiales bacterium]MBS7741972.1 sugar ABC transporter ATP-binding protein [Chelatococcus sp. HY11]MBX3539573.1 sugar ABC transporter ATP-binding protein [Chelatococcus sp.]MBX3541230.1 sugar ABC transporter ATP-binding protein [Chelatococcus sp.]MCO5074877.1 ATP-binding cassette domain-containing protein [Chelatococcus sp.]
MTDAAANASPLLSLRGIGKNYGPVVAVRDVDLDIHAGEVVAICGDNGAGKSSLIKVISGAEEPTSGTMAIRGKEVRFASPHDALEHGLATIYQDLALAPRLSIAQNVFMGSELTRPFVLPFLRVLDKAKMIEESRRYLSRLSVAIQDMTRPVERLSGGQRQAVAISRALRWNADIIIMDEPTAALGVKETALVLDLIRTLKAGGHTVILISHNMRDVVALADRVVIMGAGRKFVDRPLGDLTADDLTHLIMSGNARAA